MEMKGLQEKAASGIKKFEKFAGKCCEFAEKKPKEALVRICLFGLVFAALFLVLPKPPVYYSVLYLSPGNYGAQGSIVFADFGIKNSEQQDFNYAVSFFIERLVDDNSFDSTLLAEKHFFVKKGGEIFGSESFAIPACQAGEKMRFRIQTFAFGTQYSVHFWLNDCNS